MIFLDSGQPSWLTQFGVGFGALLALILILWKVGIIPNKTTKQEDKHDDEENGQSGDKPVSFWDLRITNLVENGVQRALATRNEQIREIVKEELAATVAARNESIRGIVRVEANRIISVLKKEL